MCRAVFKVYFGELGETLASIFNKTTKHLAKPVDTKHKLINFFEARSFTREQKR